MAAPPPQLVDAVRDRRAIAIVGSGLSDDAPSWPNLLIGLAARAESERPMELPAIAEALQKVFLGDLLVAADMLESLLRTQFHHAITEQLEYHHTLEPNRQAIDKLCSGEKVSCTTLFKRSVRTEKRRYRPTLTHYNLLRLGLRAIVTTNYDHLLETAQAYPLVYTPYSRSFPDFSKQLHVGKPVLVKLHGDVSYPSDIVLSTREFRAASGDEGTKRLLTQLFAQCTPLWLGYGFRDPDIASFLDEHMSAFGVSSGYAVVRWAAHEPDSAGWNAFIDRLDQHAVTPIPVDSFEEVPLLVRRLTRAVATQTCSRIVIASPWIDDGSDHSMPQCARAWGAYIERYLTKRIGCFRFISARPFSGTRRRGPLTELIFEADNEHWEVAARLFSGSRFNGLVPVIDVDFSSVDQSLMSRVERAQSSRQRAERPREITSTDCAPSSVPFDSGAGSQLLAEAMEAFRDGRWDKAVRDALQVVRPFASRQSWRATFLCALAALFDSEVEWQVREEAARGIVSDFWRSTWDLPIHAASAMHQAIVWWALGQPVRAEVCLDLLRRHCRAIETGSEDSSWQRALPFEFDFVHAIVGSPGSTDTQHIARYPSEALLYRRTLDGLLSLHRALHSIDVMVSRWANGTRGVGVLQRLHALKRRWG